MKKKTREKLPHELTKEERIERRKKMVDYSVKPNPKRTLYQYYAAFIRFLWLKMNRWDTMVDHKLMMNKLKNPSKYFIKKSKKSEYPENTIFGGREEPKETNIAKIQKSTKRFIRDLNSNKPMFIKELDNLKFEGEIKDYHFIAEYNQTLKQKAYAIIIDFNNGKQLKFEPVTADIDGLPHNFNAVYESGNGSAEQILYYMYDEGNDRVRVEKFSDFPFGNRG